MLPCAPFPAILPDPTCATPLSGRVTWALQALLLICITVAAATQRIHSFKSTLWAHGAVVVALGMVESWS